MSNLISWEEREIRVATVNDYQRFMLLDAGVADIVSMIETERMTPGVSWRGSAKSDLARAFAIRDHGFNEEHFLLLKSKFGLRRK